MNRLAALLSLLLAAGALRAAGPAPAGPREAASHRGARMGWWREARFGLFIHWGLYAVPAGAWEGRTGYGEWILDSARIPLPEYERLRDRFNPLAFDADAWAKAARDAGCGYVVITTKHHDGFCLWDSRLTDWTVTATPFRRDVVRELAAACRRQGLRFGLYHSIMDWHHPDYLPRRPWESRPAAGADFDRYIAHLKGQLRELLTGYGPIDILWFDGEWESTWTHARALDLDAYVRALQPGILVNNRVDPAKGEFGTILPGCAGDFGTPEQEVPAMGVPGVDWETCMTMNDHWGYNQADQAWKSATQLVRTLVDIASKGGNYLLNVGPDALGRFPQPSLERLQAMGAWMRANGESLRGTSASPFPALPWGRCTRKGKRLYLHVFDWPADGRLVVPGLCTRPVRARLLATGARVEAREVAEGVLLHLPLAAPDPHDSVLVLDFQGRPDIALPPEILAPTPIFVDRLEVRLRTPMDRVQLRATRDGSEPTARSPRVLGPLVLDHTCTVTARAFRGRRPVGPAATLRFEKVPALPASELPAEARAGLTCEVFEGAFTSCADLHAPVHTLDVPGFGLAPRPREEQYGLRFQGWVQVPREGVYRFSTLSDDGSCLWIDAQKVVDNDGPHGSRERQGHVGLAKGWHRIRLDYFQTTGGADLAVHWHGPDVPRQPISDHDVKH